MGKGLLGAGSTPTASGSPSSWWARLGFPQREGLFNPSPAPPPPYYYWFEVVTFGEQLWSVSNERRHHGRLRGSRPCREVRKAEIRGGLPPGARFRSHQG